VFDEEDGDAVVRSPRGKQHILLIRSSFHHKPSQKDQAGAQRAEKIGPARTAFYQTEGINDESPATAERMFDYRFCVDINQPCSVPSTIPR
jgi:hypothetical protein